MQIEVNLLIGIMGLVLCIATFYVGRQSSAKDEGKTEGSLETDIKYIRESISRIENNLSSNIARVDNRIDELSSHLSATSGVVNKALESSKYAHRRIDEHFGR